ncbi:hypothetical protein [Streptomyces sp. HB132]|uniref:hypothetical protein n=1 Tax=Streptomyces sp. HB132 TaxID=767388 RepID=UPI00195FAB61|nr:hypothetical protein [Streptomyces sp. HB132]MBM7439352.1 hypothetical protein [Streptomyces sp. HB132]
MLINGFENDPLVAGEGLLSLPGFWPAYLLWLCRTDDNEPEPAWFGVDEADTDAALEALTDENRWPVFRIPFDAGHTVIVVGRNLADDPGTEYFISHPQWDRHGYLATVDGHQAGPGLSWPELTHIAGTPDPYAPGARAPHVRLLLLLPALGDAVLPGEATGLIADALVQVGVAADEAPGLARALLQDHPLWEPARWALPTASPLSGCQGPFPGILHCDEPGSPRCGIRLAQGIARDQSDRLARALGTWPTT